MLEIYNGREKFYQWDINQKLIVDETIIAIQYDNGTGDALVCGVYEYEGQRVADVPNIMLQTYFPIKAYAYCGECVRAERVIEVEKRSRPDDYIYTETETLRYTTLFEMLTDLEAKHNEDIEAVEANVAALEEQAEATEEALEGLAAQHTADYNKLNQNISFVQEVATENRQKINANAGEINTLSRNLDIHIENIYDSLNEKGRTLQNHENRITTLENNPTGGGGGTASDVDWNENNPDSPAYIKNRTHYAEEKVIYPEMELELNPDLGGFIINEPPQYIPAEGEECVVRYFDKYYNLTAVNVDEDGDGVAEGTYLVDMKDETPFMFAIVNPDFVEMVGFIAAIVPMEEPEGTTLTFSAISSSVKKLDNKYLDLSSYYNKDETAALVEEEIANTKTEIEENFYTKTEIDTKNSEEMVILENKELKNVSSFNMVCKPLKAMYISLQLAGSNATENDGIQIYIGNKDNKPIYLNQKETDAITVGISKTIKIDCSKKYGFVYTNYYMPNQYASLYQMKGDITKLSQKETNIEQVEVKTISGNNFPEYSRLVIWGVYE